jgi:NADPH:quinone reductase-like Zn-dependent oxidoreductase
LKAVRIHRHGGVEELCYEDVSEPKLQSSQDVIVKLEAAALNPIDLQTRRGHCSVGVSLPQILGCEGAGVIVERGSEAQNLEVGDPICLFPALGCGVCEFCLADRESLCARLRLLGKHENGTYAQYVRVPARNCYAMPKELSFAEAAGLPLAYGTAWRMLYTDAKLEPGEWLLLRGIGGGVASAALCLALYHGAHVIVTSRRDDKLAMAEAFGAKHGINSSQVDFAAAVRRLTGKRGVDVVIDCVGGEQWSQSLAALARGGRLITCGASAGAVGQTNLQRIFWNHLKLFGAGLAGRQEIHQMLKFFTVSRARPVLDKLYPLRAAAQAHERLAAAEQFGKIVLQMDRS